MRLPWFSVRMRFTSVVLPLPCAGMKGAGRHGHTMIHRRTQGWTAPWCTPKWACRRTQQHGTRLAQQEAQADAERDGVAPPMLAGIGAAVPAYAPRTPPPPPEPPTPPLLAHEEAGDDGDRNSAVHGCLLLQLCARGMRGEGGPPWRCPQKTGCDPVGLKGTRSTGNAASLGLCDRP